MFTCIWSSLFHSSSIYRWDKPVETSHAFIAYATSIGFEPLPFSSSDGDVLGDMHWFIGLPIVGLWVMNPPLRIRFSRIRVYLMS